MGPRGLVGLPRGPRRLRGRRRGGGVREGGRLVLLIVQGPRLVRTDPDVEIEAAQRAGAALRVVGFAVVGIHLRGGLERSNRPIGQDPERIRIPGVSQSHRRDPIERIRVIGSRK